MLRKQTNKATSPRQKKKKKKKSSKNKTKKKQQQKKNVSEVKYIWFYFMISFGLFEWKLVQNFKANHFNNSK